MNTKMVRTRQADQQKAEEGAVFHREQGKSTLQKSAPFPAPLCDSRLLAGAYFIDCKLLIFN